MSAAGAALKPRVGLVRRMYDWVLHWADTPYGPVALFMLAFAESSFFPIPPDVLLIALAVARPNKAFYYATLCSIASVIGGSFGYLLGLGLWGVLEQYFYAYVPGFSEELFLKIQGLYKEWDFWVVFTAGFTPIPYKVITVTAGVVKINFLIFLIASAVSRSARFFMVGALIWRFGKPIQGFIDRYFNILSILFVFLLLLGFVVVRYVH